MTYGLSVNQSNLYMYLYLKSSRHYVFQFKFTLCYTPLLIIIITLFVCLWKYCMFNVDYESLTLKLSFLWKFWPMLGTNGHWAVRVLKRATPIVKWDIHLLWSSHLLPSVLQYLFSRLGSVAAGFEHLAFRGERFNRLSDCCNSFLWFTFLVPSQWNSFPRFTQFFLSDCIV